VAETDTLPELLPESSQFEAEDVTQLYKAIDRLNEIEKALVLLYLEEKNYQEMEAILGVNEGTLRVKMSRVKEKLRQLLK
jgi:RNA polymerase sigma-70 factor (ECF subfamily)